MAANERLKGVQVHRPIIYGSHARLLTPEERKTAPENHTHRWTLFITSATSPPPAPRASSSTDPPPIDMDYIPGGADDLSYLIKRVTFKLHETYPNPNRIFDHPPFQVSETGWGEFIVAIRIQFVAESGEKPLTLSHGIKLHHWGVPIEGPAPVPPAASTSANTASGTPAAADTDAPVDATPKPSDTPVPDDTIKAEIATPLPSNNEMQPEFTVNDSIVVQAPPVSIASTLPVHSWQYDELVFSDPLQSFLTLMNAHAPTPLPARNRRARNQREEVAAKKAKTSASSTRGTVPPSRAGTVDGTPAPGVSGTTSVPQVGIPGEPGSADVPLEFSLEMEKGEWNHLNDVRIHLVDQMDRWREKLIGQEKELAKLKEEMRV